MLLRLLLGGGVTTDMMVRFLGVDGWTFRIEEIGPVFRYSSYD